MNGPPSSGQRRDDRQPIEPHVGRDTLGDRPARDAPRADLEQLEPDIARAPQLAGRRRQQRLRQMHEPLDQPQRPLAERQLGAPRRAEQVGDERGTATPLTLVNSSAGPPAAITRRWISATSRCGSTGASTVTRSSSRRS